MLSTDLLFIHILAKLVRQGLNPTLNSSYDILIWYYKFFRRKLCLCMAASVTLSSHLVWKSCFFVCVDFMVKVMMQGRVLGIEKPFISDVISVAISLSPGCDEDVVKNSDRICKEASREEDRWDCHSWFFSFNNSACDLIKEQDMNQRRHMNSVVPYSHKVAIIFVLT